MENKVPCKKCGIQFDYSPGYAGNSRQLCNSCRKIADDEELREEMEKSITDGNKYLSKKETYDMLDILLNGNCPKFTEDAQKFICVKEVGQFIQRNGFTGIEVNLSKFLKKFDNDPVFIILFLRQLTLQQMERLATNNNLKWISKKLLNLTMPRC